MDVATLRQQLSSQTPAMIYVILGTQGILQQQARDAFMNLIPEAERDERWQLRYGDDAAFGCA